MPPNATVFLLHPDPATQADISDDLIVRGSTLMGVADSVTESFQVLDSLKKRHLCPDVILVCDQAPFVIQGKYGPTMPVIDMEVRQLFGDKPIIVILTHC